MLSQAESCGVRGVRRDHSAHREFSAANTGDHTGRRQALCGVISRL